MANAKELMESLQSSGEQDSEENAVKAEVSRNGQIVKTSIVGIMANVGLSLLKFIIGTISGSIAITLDAVNNLSDAASSVITIVGTKLAAKPSDKKHPFGYGRIEYLSAMIISVIVLYAGITSLKESVDKIIHPEAAEYTMISLIIVAIGVVVKIVLGRYFVGVGKKVNSDSLVNSGKDASLDSVISASTLVAALIFILFGVSLESWLGAIISIVIIKSGIDMLRETLSEILGQRADKDLVREIKDTARSFDGVSGVYDLVLNNYGPDVFNGSLHIEVPDTYSAAQIDELTRKISYAVYMKHHVILTAISVYSLNTRDPKVVEMRENVRKLVMSEQYVLQIHGFYVDEEAHTIRFDLVVSFNSPDRVATYHQAVEKVKKAYPDYKIIAVMDTDFAEHD